MGSTPGLAAVDGLGMDWEEYDCSLLGDVYRARVQRP